MGCLHCSLQPQLWSASHAITHDAHDVHKQSQQSLQAEYDARAAQLAEAHRRVSDAHRRLELLRATHTALSKRAAAAVCAKVAVLRGEDPTVESARVSPPRPDDHAPAKRARDSLPVATRLLLARNWKRGSAASPPLPGHIYTSASTDPGYAVLARRGETQRPDSWHLFTPPTLVPPSLASFGHHAAVSYCDLVEASGSQTGVIDFGAATAWELMNRCMAATLRQLGCDARDVCWFAQMEFEAAPGLPLSYSCTLSTPECVASCVMFLQALNFEAALISAALQLPGEHACHRQVPDVMSTCVSWQVCMYNLLRMSPASGLLVAPGPTTTSCLPRTAGTLR